MKEKYVCPQTEIVAMMDMIHPLASNSLDNSAANHMRNGDSQSTDNSGDGSTPKTIGDGEADPGGDIDFGAKHNIWAEW